MYAFANVVFPTVSDWITTVFTPLVVAAGITNITQFSPCAAMFVVETPPTTMLVMSDPLPRIPLVMSIVLPPARGPLLVEKAYADPATIAAFRPERRP